MRPDTFSQHTHEQTPCLSWLNCTPHDQKGAPCPCCPVGICSKLKGLLMLSALSTIYLMLQGTGTSCRGKCLLVQYTLTQGLSLSLCHAQNLCIQPSKHLAYHSLLDDIEQKRSKVNMLHNIRLSLITS